MVLWPNGSGTALQKLEYRFESGQHLKTIFIYSSLKKNKTNGNIKIRGHSSQFQSTDLGR